MRATQKLGPHLRRLLERRSPAAMAEACLREVRLRGSSRLMELAMMRAARRSTPILAGPFLSELGFESLYWIPMLRRLIERHGLDPHQITAISRGGADPWYRDVAGTYVDVLDLFSPQEYGRRLAERSAEVGDQKQLSVATLDREILERVRAAGGGERVTVLHPSLMFTRFRHFWIGERDIALIRRNLRHARVALPEDPGPSGLESLDEYVAVKAYFSRCFPEDQRNRRFATELIEELASQGDVVLLPSPSGVDDHRACRPASLPDAVHLADDWMSVRDNLAVQTRIIGGAKALFATYGGFSYLAPALGVPARTFYSEDNFNHAHLRVLRAAGEELGSPAFAVASVHQTRPAELATAAVAAA